MQQLEATPLVPDDAFWNVRSPMQVKLRPSDEDPRQIWKMITDAPLRLSLAYIATVSLKTRDEHAARSASPRLRGLSR